RTKYNSLGGPAGVLGLPTSDLLDVTNTEGRPIGQVAHFQVGDIYYNLLGDYYAVTGKIRTKYNSLGGPAGVLGLPTSALLNVTNTEGPPIGQVAHFQVGDIYYNLLGDYYAVTATIRTKYTSLGGPAVVLGLPTTDLLDVTPYTTLFSSQVAHFQVGDIYYNLLGDYYAVTGTIRTKYNSLGGPAGSL